MTNTGFDNMEMVDESHINTQRRVLLNVTARYHREISEQFNPLEIPLKQTKENKTPKGEGGVGPLSVILQLPVASIIMSKLKIFKW